MINYKIISHYSKALVQLATSKERLEKQLTELEEIVQLVREIPTFKQFINHPFISAHEKKKTLHHLLANKCDKLSLNFLFFLIDKKRIRYLEEIVKDYHLLVNEELGILEGYVTTVIPLETQMKEKIKIELEKHYRKRIKLEEKIDPQILGGLLIMIGNQVLDNSIRSRLIKLKENLFAVNV